MLTKCKAKYCPPKDRVEIKRLIIGLCLVTYKKYSVLLFSERWQPNDYGRMVATQCICQLSQPLLRHEPKTQMSIKNNLSNITQAPRQLWRKTSWWNPLTCEGSQISENVLSRSKLNCYFANPIMALKSCKIAALVWIFLMQLIFPP